MLQLPWLNPEIIEFPDTFSALEEPNGLLAAGGELSADWLLSAYSQGIFPWFRKGEPILWWSPSPRAFIYANQLHISKSLRKVLRQKNYEITFDKAFDDVVLACAQPRQQQLDGGTWITDEMMSAYSTLHYMGHAHSVEVWMDGKLAGGLYGIALGRMFFGESMFSFRTNGSKIALFHLVEHLKEWHYIGIDCQVHNDHLESMGAEQIPRIEFESLLAKHVQNTPCHWKKAL